MQTIDFSSAISELDQQIADAKTYLRKLRQYKRTLAKIEQEQAAPTTVAPAVPPAPAMPDPAPVASVAVEAEPDPWTLPDPAPVAPAAPAPTTPTLRLLPPAKAPDLRSMGIRELRKYAIGKVPGAARMKKADLLEALVA